MSQPYSNLIVERMTYLVTWSFSDLGFSKLPLDELNRTQICDLQNQAKEVGVSSMEGPP